jgi:hypothetical protein
MRKVADTVGRTPAVFARHALRARASGFARAAAVPWHAIVLVVTVVPVTGLACGACSSCGDTVPAEARVRGSHGFVRCPVLSPGPAREWAVGDLRLRRRDRVLTVEGGPPALDVAFAAGPAPSAGLDAAALARLRAARPHVVVIVGGLGDMPDDARRSARAFSAIGVPVLFLAGGRDEAPVVAETFAALDDGSLGEEARGRLVDITPLHLVHLGEADLVPLGGAPGGRYARTDDACGFTAADADARAVPVGARQGVPRLLVSWAHPSPAPGPFDVDLGDPLVTALARRLGAVVHVSAWPGEVGEVSRAGPGTRAVRLPRVFGPSLERADGARTPAGLVTLRIERSGIRPRAALGSSPSDETK